MQYEPLRIYHESQSSQLCARHCLNNLLQGPYFTEFDLSKIALDLDKEEQQLLAQDGDENNGLVEWLKANPQSQNVSDDGNFSIQVLRRALDNLGLTIKYWGNESTADAQKHPENEQGFICNLQAHWFAIRRIGGVWYNLNSLSGLPETTAVPTTISNFYLSAYLSTLVNDGYSINVVRSNKWPHLHSYDAQQRLPEYAKWYLATNVKSRSESYPKHLLQQVDKSRNGKQVTNLGWGANNGGGIGMGMGMGTGGAFNVESMTAEQQMQYAMQQSMAQNNNGNINGFGGMGGIGGALGMGTGSAMGSAMGSGMGMEEDPELAHALALSMNNKNTNNTNNNTNDNKNTNSTENMDEDEESMLATALAMSMEEDEKGTEKEEKVSIEVVEEPNEDEDNVCSIQLRLPQNKRVERKFKAQHTLNEVANFVKSQDSSFNDIVFVCPPMNSYHDMDLTLESICKELNSRKLAFIVKENQNKQ